LPVPVSPTIGLLGTGLIGGSIGLGLARAGWTVIGWDPDPAALEVALERGALSSAAVSEADLTDKALDLLVLAGPTPAIIETLQHLPTDLATTDVSGVKGSVMAAGARLHHFVAGHPMAGLEVSGPRFSSATLFRGAAWILIADAAEEVDLRRVEEMVKALGAHPVRMTALEHDKAIAVISHLPHLLASALLQEASASVTDLGLVGGSFRDLTRVVASDSAPLSELLIANRDSLASALRRFLGRLERWLPILDEAATSEANSVLSESSRMQAKLRPPVRPVAVALLDQPGELARMGRALERSKVDVRDLSLRHALDGGGGRLEILVREGDAAVLVEALRAEGLVPIT
jgi:prephenate dehydrogenase